MADTDSGPTSQRRRTPVQRRSRGRVQDILAATGELLAEGGVDAVTTRALAEHANISVAAVYQYFPNRDAIIDAYLEQATSRIDASVFEKVLELEVVSPRTVIEAAVFAHLHFYQQNYELVQVWISSRTDSIVLSRARKRNADLGRWLEAAFRGAGFLRDSMPPFGSELVVEVCQSVIEFALITPRPIEEQNQIVGMGVEMVLSQVELFMTPRALAGINAAEFATALAEATSI